MGAIGCVGTIVESDATSGSRECPIDDTGPRSTALVAAHFEPPAANFRQKPSEPMRDGVATIFGSAPHDHFFDASSMARRIRFVMDVI